MQAEQAVYRLHSIAREVAQREGVSQNEALTRLSQSSFGMQGNLSGDRGVFGKIGSWALGVSGEGTLSGNTQVSSQRMDQHESGSQYHLVNVE